MPDHTDQPTTDIADLLRRRQFSTHMHVRPDGGDTGLWRASCDIHDWYTTGIYSTVEDAAWDHIARQHEPCAAPSDRTFAGVQLYCHLLLDHEGDHMNRGNTWPRTVPAVAPTKPPRRDCFYVLTLQWEDNGPHIRTRYGLAEDCGYATTQQIFEKILADSIALYGSSARNTAVLFYGLADNDPSYVLADNDRANSQ